MKECRAIYLNTYIKKKCFDFVLFTGNKVFINTNKTNIHKDLFSVKVVYFYNSKTQSDPLSMTMRSKGFVFDQTVNHLMGNLHIIDLLKAV